MGCLLIWFYHRFRNGIKKVIQLLLQLRSVDKAKLVATEHNLDDLVKEAWHRLESLYVQQWSSPNLSCREPGALCPALLDSLVCSGNWRKQIEISPSLLSLYNSHFTVMRKNNHVSCECDETPTSGADVYVTSEVRIVPRASHAILAYAENLWVP